MVIEEYDRNAYSSIESLKFPQPLEGLSGIAQWAWGCKVHMDSSCTLCVPHSPSVRLLPTTPLL